MAFQLDSNIPLLARGVDVAGSVASGLQKRGMLDQLQQAKEQAPLRQQMLEQQARAGQLINEQNQQQAELDDQDRVIDSIANTYSGIKSMVDTGKFNDAADALEANKAVLAQSGITNFEDTDLAIAALRSGDPKQIRAIQLQGDQAIEMSEARRKLESGPLSTAQKERADLLKDLVPALDDKGNLDVSKLDPVSRSAAMALGLIAKSGTVSTAERIAGTEGLAEEIGESQSTIKQAEETGKLKAQKGLLPEIKAAVKLAEKEAQSKGEVSSELNSAKAALPGLKKVVSNLKALSGDATFTLAGRGFNAIAKELGFSTKGSTARSAMVAMVDNQVLPLLKPIFGAAFTAAEGDRLRNAFLDPDSTPDSRIASLNAFQEQMERNIEAKELELSGQVQGSIGQQDTGISEDQFRAMSPEQRAEVISQLQRGR